MDRQLLDQLDRMETLDQEREQLRSVFQTLYGRPAPEAWLSSDLHAKIHGTVKELLPITRLDTHAVSSPARPALRQRASSIIFVTRLLAACALLGAALPLGIGGLLGHDGQWPDRLINMNSSFALAGGFLLLASLVTTPWKAIRKWYKKPSQWLFRRKGRAWKNWSGLAFFGLALPAAVAGGLFAEIQAEAQMTQQSLTVFDTYNVQNNMLKAIFQIDANGDSGLPGLLSHDSPACQLFQAELSQIDQVPTQEIGQLLNGAQAAQGYAKGCLTAAELFTRENAYSARANAWSYPAIRPGSEIMHQAIAMSAGLNDQEWCLLTNQWPQGTSPSIRREACEALPGAPLDHPMTLSDMAIKPPAGISLNKTY